MEEKTDSSFEEHFPFDSIVGDQEFGTLSLYGHSLSISTLSTLPVDITLAFYLLQNPVFLQNLENKNVLVVGNQDQGLAGVAALKIGATSVVFSGSSAASMRSCTWANIFLNCPNKMTSVRCLSAAGSDWAAVSNRSINVGKFGLVMLFVEGDLSSDLWDEIQKGLDQHLDVGGIALVATRSLPSQSGQSPEGRISAADATDRYESVTVWRHPTICFRGSSSSNNYSDSNSDSNSSGSGALLCDTGAGTGAGTGTTLSNPARHVSSTSEATELGSNSSDGAPIPGEGEAFGDTLSPTVLGSEVVVLRVRGRQ